MGRRALPNRLGDGVLPFATPAKEDRSRKNWCKTENKVRDIIKRPMLTPSL